MPTRDEILRTKTFKDEAFEVSRRVYYSLTQDKALEAHRNAKLLAFVVERLHAAGQLTDDDVDTLLFDTVMS